MDHCGQWRINHVWRAARAAALRRANGCDICHTTERLEVHHRTWNPEHPPYTTGCWNHQENLEVLCRAHHRLEHAERRRRKHGEAYQLPLVA